MWTNVLIARPNIVKLPRNFVDTSRYSYGKPSAGLDWSWWTRAVYCETGHWALRAGLLGLVRSNFHKLQPRVLCTMYCSCVRTNHATNYYCYVGARMCGEMLCPVLVCSVTKHRGYHIVNIVSSVTEYSNDIRCLAVMHCNI